MVRINRLVVLVMMVISQFGNNLLVIFFFFGKGLFGIEIEIDMVVNFYNCYINIKNNKLCFYWQMLLNFY